MQIVTFLNSFAHLCTFLNARSLKLDQKSKETTEGGVLLILLYFRYYPMLDNMEKNIIRDQCFFLHTYVKKYFFYNFFLHTSGFSEKKYKGILSFIL